MGRWETRRARQSGQGGRAGEQGARLLGARLEGARLEARLLVSMHARTAQASSAPLQVKQHPGPFQLGSRACAPSQPMLLGHAVHAASSAPTTDHKPCMQ